MTQQWRNWSGGVEATPTLIASPETEEEVVALVKAAHQSGSEVRVVGTGHSFMPLCATSGTLISLDRLQGVVSVDQARQQATIWAGTKISRIGEPLLAAGLALANQGDIDYQALAGAVSTGTHGTGRTLGNMSSSVVGLRLILASGELLDCSATQAAEVFKAAQVSVGTIGLLTQITVQALPAYRLHERTWIASVEECFGQLDDLIARHRHFEFFWVPQYDACAMKALHPTDQPIGVLAPPAAVEGRLTRYMNPERIDWSYRIFPSERTLLFNEMEYSVPAAAGPACFLAIRHLMQQQFPDVLWPVEYRTIRADDIWLSPATGRETVAISIHQAGDLPYEPFFRAAEEIFRAHQGRPHWGKINYLQANDFQTLYPQWSAFQAVRHQVDPAGTFLNDYLRDAFV